MALTEATVSIASNVHDIQCNSATPPACGSFFQQSQILYGFAAGGGVDWALTPNIFPRAEFEWDVFNAPPGILLTLATGRFGAGFKF